MCLGQLYLLLFPECLRLLIKAVRQAGLQAAGEGAGVRLLYDLGLRRAEVVGLDV